MGFAKFSKDFKKETLPPIYLLLDVVFFLPFFLPPPFISPPAGYHFILFTLQQEQIQEDTVSRATIFDQPQQTGCVMRELLKETDTNLQLIK